MIPPSTSLPRSPISNTASTDSWRPRSAWARRAATMRARPQLPCPCSRARPVRERERRQATTTRLRGFKRAPRRDEKT